MVLNKLYRCINEDGCDVRKKRRENANSDRILLFAGMGYEVELDKCINISEYLDKINFSGNAQSSIFCDLVREQCIGSVYIDASNTMILTNKSFEGVLETINSNLSHLDSVDPVAYNQLVKDTLNFFSERNVVVLQEGVQGKIFKAGQIVQSYGSVALTVESIMMSRVLGVTGSKVLAGQPLLYVALPTVGGIFFHGMSMIVGQNAVGRSCQSIGNILLLPMKGAELILNNIVFLPLGKITGIPILLNMTQTINMGPGLSVEDAKKMIDIAKKGKLSPLWKKISHTYEIWFKK